MQLTDKPKIALITGDPNGIGPELAAKLVAEKDITDTAHVVIVADSSVFEEGARIGNVNSYCRTVDDISQSTFSEQSPVILNTPTYPGRFADRATATEESGQFQMDCLATGLKLCQQQLVDGMCFAPLNKEAMHLAGLEHEDESGFFIEILNHKGRTGILNTLGNLWTSRATSHVPHRQVSELLNEDSIIESIRIIDQTLRVSGNENPRIAVAGLNPHAGDGGMFGTEEIDIIEPAIRKAKEAGINASGPFPPDTIFLMGRDGKFDAIATMYHDQGQIAMKLMGFDHGVTVHAGFPYPITTSAHGSAYDIAGKGVANVKALREAFLLVCSMV